MSKSALSGQVEILTETIEAEFKRLEKMLLEEKQRVNARLNSICGEADYNSDRVTAIAKKVTALERHTGFTPKHARDAECEPEVTEVKTWNGTFHHVKAKDSKPAADTPSADSNGLIAVKEGQRFLTDDGQIYQLCPRADNGKLDFAFTGLLRDKKAA